MSRDRKGELVTFIVLLFIVITGGIGLHTYWSSVCKEINTKVVEAQKQEESEPNIKVYNDLPEGSEPKIVGDTKKDKCLIIHVPKNYKQKELENIRRRFQYVNDDMLYIYMNQ